MSKSLTDRIRDYRIIGGLFGALALGTFAGCKAGPNDVITPAMTLSVIANANAMKSNDPDKARAWMGVGDFADKYGQRENALDAANAKKDDNKRNENNGNQNNNNGNNSNQNNGNQNNNPPVEEKWPEGMTKIRDVYFLTCNYAEDLNKDGRIKYRDGEYIGIKKKFTLKEKISYAIIDARVKKGDVVSMIVKNCNGQVLSTTHLEEADIDGYCNQWLWFEPGRLKESNTAFWYKKTKDNKEEYLGKSEITIEDK